MLFRRKDYVTAEQRLGEFLPLEDYRDAFNQMRVLHEAVTLSGIAGMGPILPLISNLEPEHHDKVRAMVGQLRRLDRSMQPVAA
jgi:dihydrodipicolinate synthase/N-acetylneuraminate lyase